jgi:hypothetical protein
MEKRTMHFDLNVANATFGHVAQTGAPALTDVLSDVIASTPREPEARASYLERNASSEAAGRLVTRAYVRALTIGEAAMPFIGKRYSVDFAEAANGADLLIASDLLMAMLLDRKLASSETMKVVLGTVFPELFEPNLAETAELNASGQGPEILAIAALRQQGVDAQTSAALIAYHGDVIAMPPAADPTEGLLADVALLRDVLFETYLDRKVAIDDREVSKRALKVAMYALAMGHALAGRAANRRRRAQLS